MSRLDNLIATALGLEVRLQACLARLQAGTDDEALHDLRIALRRLRSLLRPLRGIALMAELDAAAQAVGRLSSPLRDEEVLLAEIGRRGLEELRSERQQALQQGYLLWLARPELATLLQRLGAWPEGLREQQRAGQLGRLDRRIRRHLRKQRKRLREALADPAHDRHRLRLLIKRLRYADEAYPELSGVSAELRAALKAAQSALGDWHDRWQWLLRLAEDSRLASVEQAWRQELLQAEQQADRALQVLDGILGA